MKQWDEAKGFIGHVIGIILLFVVFHGDPDVTDAIRAKALAWAGLTTATHSRPSDNEGPDGNP